MQLTNSLCDALFMQYPLEVKQQVIAILKELESAEKRHPAWPIDFVHAASIVSEESGELVQAANQHQWENGKFYKMMDEAKQTGAMAIRFLVNAEEIEPSSWNKLKETCENFIVSADE